MCRYAVIAALTPDERLNYESTRFLERDFDAEARFALFTSPRYFFVSKHQLMTAGMFHVTDLTPGSSGVTTEIRFN